MKTNAMGAALVMAALFSFVSCGEKKESAPAKPEVAAVTEADSLPVPEAVKETPVQEKKLKSKNVVVVFDGGAVWKDVDGKMKYVREMDAGEIVKAVLDSDGNIETKNAERTDKKETKPYSHIMDEGEDLWIRDTFIVPADYAGIINTDAVLYGDTTIDSIKKVKVMKDTVVAVIRSPDPAFFEIAYYKDGLQKGNFVKADKIDWDENNSNVKIRNALKRITFIEKKVEDEQTKQVLIAELRDGIECIENHRK